MMAREASDLAPRADRQWNARLEWLSLPLLLAIWQLAAMIAASRFLPTPVFVAGQIVDLAVNGHLLADFQHRGSPHERHRMAICYSNNSGWLRIKRFRFCHNFLYVTVTDPTEDHHGQPTY